MHRKQPGRAQRIREILGLILLFGSMGSGIALIFMYTPWWVGTVLLALLAVGWIGWELATAPVMTDPDLYGTEHDPARQSPGTGTGYTFASTDLDDERAYIPASVPAFEAADPEPSRDATRD